MKLGVYGGSFNPVHFGHLLLAESCRESCQLDQVLFVPALEPPHKQSQRLAEPRHRVEMLQLAIAGHESFAICQEELERGGVSYTFQTLESLSKAFANDELFLLMGADSLDEFHTWKHPERICELASPIIVHRRGADPVDFNKLSPYYEADTLNQIAQHQVDFPAIEISSSDIRERIAANSSIRYRLPRAVEKYIETHKLYRER